MNLYCGLPFAVPSNVSTMKGIPMSQQNELPENSEACVLVAHLNMDVDTDREALVHMLSAVFAKLMGDDKLSVLEMYAMMHCITEHASVNTVRELTRLEQYVLEQVRSRGFELSDAVQATHHSLRS